MLSLEDYNAMEETMNLLSNPSNAMHLRESISEFENGNYYIYIEQKYKDAALSIQAFDKPIDEGFDHQIKEVVLTDYTLDYYHPTLVFPNA
jgi:hypothetical protein